jgi:ABC-2 type transport system permease protein
MSTALAYSIRDSRTMLRRSMRRIIRYPSMTVLIIGMPVVFLLLFVFVFGGTMGAGLGYPTGGRAAYATFITPTIIVMTVAATVQGTAILVAMDMTQGIVSRLKTMAIARTAVLTGHAWAAFIQTLLSVLVVIAVALLVGFRPTADPVEWLAAYGLIAVVTAALTWLAIGLGLAAKSVETASNTPMILTFLPFLSSGFVPTESMPPGLRWFAEHQPFTPIIDTLRGLLVGTAIGSDWLVALGWCLLIGVAGYLWSRRLFNREIGG